MCKFCCCTDEVKSFVLTGLSLVRRSTYLKKKLLLLSKCMIMWINAYDSLIMTCSHLMLSCLQKETAWESRYTRLTLLVFMLQTLSNVSRTFPEKDVYACYCGHRSHRAFCHLGNLPPGRGEEVGARLMANARECEAYYLME